MKLYHPTNATVAVKMWRKGGKLGLLFTDDGRLASGFMWVRLPLKAHQVTMQKFRDGKVTPLPPHCDLDAAVKAQRDHQQVSLKFIRIFFAGTNLDYSSRKALINSARWYAEFKDENNEQLIRLDGDYYAILVWAGAVEWQGYRYGNGAYYVEGWNEGVCIGGVMSITEH